MGDTLWSRRGVGALCLACMLNAMACATTTTAQPPADADITDRSDGSVDTATRDTPDVALDTPDSSRDVVVDRDAPLALDVAPLAPTDAPAVDPCERLVDLNARGTTEGDTLVWTADGPATAERVSTPLPGDAEGAAIGLGFVTALRYTAPRDGVVRFAARSLDRAQPVSLVMRVVTACARDARVLSQGIVSEASHTHLMHAGESVALLILARFPLPLSVNPYGPFEVRVRVTPPAVEGAPCERSELACATGLACAAFLGVCRPAGELGQPCLPGGRCNGEGNVCGLSDVCVRSLALGDACESVYAACPAGSECRGGVTCVAIGARGGSCRGAAPYCDDGLSCEAGQCNPSRAVGETCDASQSCVEGAHCTSVGGVTRCVRDGDLDGWCNVRRFACALGLCTDSLRTCSAGLACSWRMRAEPRCRPAVPLGGRCDETEATSVCADGSCVGGVCVRDGTLNATCRESAAPCDDGLGCVGLTQRFCRAIASVGASCSSRACARGAKCLPEASSSARCVADGASGGRCRPAAPSCEVGLTCTRPSSPSSGLCLPTAPEGATCRDVNPTAACVEGTTCVNGRCARDGALGGGCRAVEPRCDAPAVCNSQSSDVPGACVAALAIDALCGAEAGLCVRGSSCMFRNGADRCVADGLLNARCRDVAPYCEVGVCEPTQRKCLPVVARGDRCAEPSISSVCASGTSCLGVASGDSRCVQDGVDGGRCRAASPPCDAGLRCSGPALALTSRCAP